MIYNKFTHFLLISYFWKRLSIFLIADSLIDIKFHQATNTISTLFWNYRSFCNNAIKKILKIFALMLIITPYDCALKFVNELRKTSQTPIYLYKTMEEHILCSSLNETVELLFTIDTIPYQDVWFHLKEHTEFDSTK
jgi:hypothetical protein